MFDFLSYWQFWIVAVAVGSFCVVVFFWSVAEAKREGERTPWPEQQQDDGPLGRLYQLPEHPSFGLWMQDEDVPEFYNAVERGWVSGASVSDLMRGRGRDL